MHVGKPQLRSYLTDGTEVTRKGRAWTVMVYTQHNFRLTGEQKYQRPHAKETHILYIIL